MITNQTMSADEFNASRGRKIGGKVAQSAGRSFERDLDITHEAYRASGQADIIRLPVPTAPMPRDWLRDPKRHGGTARKLSERQRADYMGSFLWNGTMLPIAMEAKANGEELKALPIIRPDKSGFGLKFHQLEALVIGWRKFRIVGCVVWRNGQDLRVIPPWVLDDALHEYRMRDVRKIPSEKGIPYQTAKCPGAGLIDDWLKPLKEALVIASIKNGTNAAYPGVPGK